MGKALEITDANFETTTQDGYTLVDFWAPWCAPCRFIGPLIEDLAGTYEGRVKLGKLNVDQNQQTAMKYRVMNLPTVMLFKDGEPIEVIVGARNRQQYAQAIEKHLELARI